MTLVASLLAACGGGTTEQGATDVASEVATDVATYVAADVATTPADSDVAAAGDPWAEVDRIAREAIAGNGAAGVGLAIYDAADELRFFRIYGDFEDIRRVAVASASKLVAGLVLFDLVGRGELSLESTTGEVLGWTGPGATITLRHLMSFTSGLAPAAACTAMKSLTLGECVDAIAAAALDAAPGEAFAYGSTHLHVAARMAEVATGKSWNMLFRERVADPLGLHEGVRFFTLPRRVEGFTNPLVAGGLRASMNEYAELLAIVFHRGRYRGMEIGTDALYDAQAIEPFPDVTIVKSPMVDADLPYNYGLTAWLHCAPASSSEGATPCPVVSSPGAFGWMPWIDREHGYYAILGMQSDAADIGIAAFSVELADALRAAIGAALALDQGP